MEPPYISGRWGGTAGQARVPDDQPHRRQRGENFTTEARGDPGLVRGAQGTFYSPVASCNFVFVFVAVADSEPRHGRHQDKRDFRFRPNESGTLLSNPKNHLTPSMYVCPPPERGTPGQIQDGFNTAAMPSTVHPPDLSLSIKLWKYRNRRSHCAFYFGLTLVKIGHPIRLHQ